MICWAALNEEKKPFGKDTTTDLTHVHVRTNSVNHGNMPSSVELPTGVRGKVQPANAAAPLPPSAHIWAAHFRPSFPAKDQYKGPQLHPSFISWSSSVQQHEGKTIMTFPNHPKKLTLFNPYQLGPVKVNLVVG